MLIRARAALTGGVPSRIDRDTLLATVDLAALATELCGPPHGHGRNARWRCPNPNHPDVHPSMTVFHGHRSDRWHCHACGAGGTAIDLYATATSASIGAAIRDLANRAGLERRDATAPVPSVPTIRAPLPGAPEPALRGPDPAIELYVAAAQQLLWSPQGQGSREYLRSRNLLDRELLELNRVGYDPGPRELQRATGLPHRGSGIVLPVLDDADRAIYCMTRYFDPTAAGRRYDNVSSERAPNPKIAAIKATPTASSHSIVVTEGIFDGLSVASCGYRAVSLLGAAHADVAAEGLARTGPFDHVVLILDGDVAGGRAAREIATTLAANAIAVTIVNLTMGDANGLLCGNLVAVLESVVGTAAARSGDRFRVECIEPHSPSPSFRTIDASIG